MCDYRYKTSLKTIKQQTIDIAHDLRYGRDVIERLRNATSEFELTRIMCQARKSSR